MAVAVAVAVAVGVASVSFGRVNQNMTFTVKVNNPETVNKVIITFYDSQGEFEYGWQNLFHNNYLLRAGLRTNGVAATSGVVDMIGIQVSLGYRF